MEIASVVFEHGFDQGMLEQIDTLRTIRLNLTENMLRNLDATAAELKMRGIFDVTTAAEQDELKRELQDRIATLRERIARPDVIHADEIGLYIDLLNGDDGDDGDADQKHDS